MTYIDRILSTIKTNNEKIFNELKAVFHKFIMWVVLTKNNLLRNSFILFILPTCYYIVINGCANLYNNYRCEEALKEISVSDENKIVEICNKFGTLSPVATQIEVVKVHEESIDRVYNQKEKIKLIQKAISHYLTILRSSSLDTAKIYYSLRALNLRNKLNNILISESKFGHNEEYIELQKSVKQISSAIMPDLQNHTVHQKIIQNLALTDSEKASLGLLIISNVMEYEAFLQQEPLNILENAKASLSYYQNSNCYPAMKSSVEYSINSLLSPYII